MKSDARKTYSLAELAERFGGVVVGNSAVRITQVASLETAGPGDLSFLTSKKYQKLLTACQAEAVIVPEEARDATMVPRIISGNPYAYYARVATLLNPEPAASAGIHPQAFVDPQARVADSASIGAFAVIEAGALIGEAARIGPGCFVGRYARVGDGSRLFPNVTIYHDCVIGNRVIIHSGAVIGADGFGMAMDAGKWLKIPQIGRVLVGDEVEIGANTTIDRGALDDTVIEEGVKLDNQIQIGHNCRIGAYTAIAGCVGIAGSTRIGKYCKLGGGAMISGHLVIGDRVDVSGGTLVAKSISKPGAYTAVFPMSPHDEWLKNASQVRHLDEMRDRIRALEEAIKNNERKQP